MSSLKIIDDTKEIIRLDKSECPTFGEACAALDRGELTAQVQVLPLTGKIEVRFSDYKPLNAVFSNGAENGEQFLDCFRDKVKQAELRRRTAPPPITEKGQPETAPAYIGETATTDNRATKTISPDSESEKDKATTPKAKKNKPNRENRDIRRDPTFIEAQGYIIDTVTGTAQNKKGQYWLDENGDKMVICVTEERARLNYRRYDKSVKTRFPPKLTMFGSFNLGLGTNIEEIKTYMANFFEAAKKHFGSETIKDFVYKFETNKSGDTWHSHAMITTPTEELATCFCTWCKAYWSGKSKRAEAVYDIKILETEEEIEQKWRYLDPLYVNHYDPDDPRYKNKKETLKYYPPKGSPSYFKMFQSSVGFILDGSVKAKNSNDLNQIIKDVSDSPATASDTGNGYIIQYDGEPVRHILYYNYIAKKSVCQAIWRILNKEVYPQTASAISPESSPSPAEEEAVAPVALITPESTTQHNEETATTPPAEALPADTNATDTTAHRPTIDEWIVEHSPYMTEWRERKRLYGHF